MRTDMWGRGNPNEMQVRAVIGTKYQNWASYPGTEDYAWIKADDSEDAGWVRLHEARLTMPVEYLDSTEIEINCVPTTVYVYDTCSMCGACVADRLQHTAWHKMLEGK